MSGYDLSSKVPSDLMEGRLGVYEKTPYDEKTNSIEGIELLRTRFRHNGGNSQQERMIKDKRRSLNRVVWFSYQAAEINKVDATNTKPIRALINPNKLAQDYDEKLLSVGFEYGFKVGDVFEWVGTKTHWLIYLQELTELAYFRGSVRKCTYEISWEDEEGRHTTYAAITGPEQKTLSTKSTHGIVIDTPNYSLDILVPNNEQTLKYFKRYTEFYLKGDSTCWRVEGIDIYSIPGLIRVFAKEYYANKDEDDIENGIVGGLIPEVESPNTKEEEIAIRGETFIKIKTKYEYRFNGRVAAKWSVDKNYPVTLIPNTKDPRKVTLQWDSPYSGQFELHYGDYSKTIVVESLF